MSSEDWAGRLVLGLVLVPAGTGGLTNQECQIFGAISLSTSSSSSFSLFSHLMHRSALRSTWVKAKHDHSGFVNNLNNSIWKSIWERSTGEGNISKYCGIFLRVSVSGRMCSCETLDSWCRGSGLVAIPDLSRGKHHVRQ